MNTVTTGQVDLINMYTDAHLRALTAFQISCSFGQVLNERSTNRNSFDAYAYIVRSKFIHVC